MLRHWTCGLISASMRPAVHPLAFVPLGLFVLGSLVPGASAAQPELPVLTRIASIRGLSQDEGARGYPVHVRGTVTHFDERHQVDLVLHDGELGQYVLPRPTRRRSATGRASGSATSSTCRGGRCEAASHRTSPPTPSVSSAGGTCRQPASYPYAGLISGRHDCDYVEIEGIVQRVWRSSDPTSQSLFAEVAFEEGVVRALFWDYAPADLTRLTDARVRLRGNLGAIFGPSEQLRGVSLFAGRTRDVTIVEPAPAPFGQAPRAISSLYHYSADGEVTRRIRIRGVATFYLAGHPVEVSDYTTRTRFRSVRHVLYIQDDTGAARIETDQDTPVKPGDLVDASGFAAVSPGRPMLRNAVLG